MCTPIQAETLPVALAGKDVAGQAQTGTGKTAAFLVAVYNHLLTHEADEHRKVNQPRALILAPTRELAIQIHSDARVIGQHTGLKPVLAYGGTGYEQQRDEITAGVDILIGTPGRLIDYFKQHVYNLKMAQVIVLDEADRMFDLGFIKDIRYLFHRCPPPEQRLGLLFSATLSHRVQELAYEHMNNPVHINVEPEKVTADRVRQVLYHTSNEDKIPLLVGLLSHGDSRRSIVFVNTKRTAERVWSYLEGNGFKCAVLSGDVPQTKRQRLLKEFQEGKLLILQDFKLETVKTKKVAELLKTFGVEKAILVAEDNRELSLSARNLPGALAVNQNGVNVYDLLKYDYLMLSDASLKKIEGALEK